MKSPRKRLEKVGRDGFSVIELLVVVVIMTAILAASIPAIRGHTETIKLQRTSTDIAGTFKLARQRAVATNNDVVVVFDSNNGTYLAFEDADGDGVQDADETVTGPHSVPKRISIADVSFSGETVTFGPGGSATETGSVVVYNSRARALRIDLMAATGLVYISDVYEYEGTVARGE
jgi:prepilin-type N-terminal cleavage/methylation domain-containing protein